MKYRAAAIQMTSAINITDNLASAKKWIKKAADEGANFVVLPEMFAVMGMDQMDKVKAREEWGHGPIQDFLREAALENKVWLVGGTIPIADPVGPEKVHATCILINDEGHVAARYDKIHLFDVIVPSTKEVHQESKVVTHGKEVVVAQTPFGKVGLAVCYDVRFPEMFRAMQNQNVELVVLPSAFTSPTGKAHWDILVRARAIENQVYMIAAAQGGTHESGRKTFGHSMIVDPWGTVLASLPEGEGVVVADIDTEYLTQVREKFPALSHRKI